MKKHYPKIISTCCFLFVFVNVGLPSTSFSVYQPYLVSLPGVGDAGGSLILSVRTLATLAAMFVVNHFYNRLDCRLTVTLGCMLTATGFLVYSLADSLVLFCVGAVCAGLGYGIGGNVGMTLLTGRWYKSRVGSAVGFATVGSGLAGMVVPPVALLFIEGISLSSAFLAEAVFSFAIAAFVFALIRNHPDDIGARPYIDEHADADDAGGRAHKPVHSKREGKVELSFRAHALLMLAMVGIGIMSVGALAYYSILMTTCGYDTVFAASMLSIVGACLTVSKFASGVLFDKVGVVRATVTIFFLSVLGLALCCLMPLQSVVLAVVGSICYGAGVSAGSVGISVWSIVFSNDSNRSKIVKDFQVGYALGGFIGDTFPGLLAHVSATYVPSYAIILIATALSGLIIVAVYRSYCSL